MICHELGEKKGATEGEKREKQDGKRRWAKASSALKKLGG